MFTPTYTRTRLYYKFALYFLKIELRCRNVHGLARGTDKRHQSPGLGVTHLRLRHCEQMMAIYILNHPKAHLPTASTAECSWDFINLGSSV